MSARSLPEDVGTLAWLASEVLGVAESTCYRLAATGQLADYGVFKIGNQYRVSKLKAIRAVHGAEPKAP